MKRSRLTLLCMVIAGLSIVPACGGSDDEPAPLIVTYSSDPHEQYAKLAWDFIPGVPPPMTMPAWLYNRVVALSGDPTTIPAADSQMPYDFSGLGNAQSVEASFNLTTGTGTATIRSVDGRTTVRLRGLDGAFAVAATSTLPALATVFGADDLAATPFLIHNADPSRIVIDEWTVDGVEYSAELTDVGARFGVFFPSDPALEIEPRPFPKEKWCWIINDTCAELQEY